MKKERFYYSPDLSEVKLKALVYKDEILGMSQPLSIKRLPRITVCGILSNDLTKMSFGIARCSEKDTFIRSEGRNLSQSRCEKSPIRVVSIGEGDKISDVFMDNALSLEQEFLYNHQPIK